MFLSSLEPCNFDLDQCGLKFVVAILFNPLVSYYKRIICLTKESCLDQVRTVGVVLSIKFQDRYPNKYVIDFKAQFLNINTQASEAIHK